jgi:hypothetical protein
VAGSAAKRCCTNLVHTLGHRKNLPASKVAQWHAQSTRVAFGSLSGKGQEPLTIVGRWPRTITNSCHNSSASPRHLGGSNHQEKQEIHSHNDPQVPLDANTQVNALRITQSHFGFTIKQERWVEGSLLSSQGCQECQNDQERWLGAGSIYRAPQTNRVVGSWFGLCPSRPDAPLGVTGCIALASAH